MSHKLANSNKPNKSASKHNQAQSWTVGDSRLHLSHCITNATGTFSGFINHPLMLSSLSMLLVGAICLVNVLDTHATGSSLTVSVTSGSGAFVNIPPTSEGKFGATGATTFGVTTTHASGYTLTASATDLSFTDTEGGNGVAGTTYTIPTHSIVNGVSADNYADDTYATTNELTNTWGYQPSVYNSLSNALYLPAPIDTTQTLDVTSSSDNASYNIAIGTRLDHTITLGTYETSFTLAVTANPTPYTITYNKNTTDTVADMPDNTSTTADGETITLSENIPIRDGLIFRGWCTTQVADGANCSGTKYIMGDTYALDQTSDTNEIVLYAMWGGCDNNLYNLVACQVKKDGSGNAKTQTLADMQAVITEPTSSNPATDTSNSGVYKYDAATYGVSSDANNNYDIYYFRGILDSAFTTSDSYGGIPSTGNSGYYQNYVRLADTSNGRASTCWRIVRTTGSGGVKMIYNGVWNGATCANAKEDAAAGSTYYNRGKSEYGSDRYGVVGFATYVGYNYNNNYGYNNTSATSAIPNSSLFNNAVASNFRTEVEKWYRDTSNLDNYENNGKLEVSAGWCNDRTTKTSPSMGDSSVPYSVSSALLFFGARFRNVNTGGKLSLRCPNVTNRDLLTTMDGLGEPLALLNIDEAALAGAGMYHWYDGTGQNIESELSSNYSSKSFLRTSGDYALLSPNGRDNSSGRVSILDIRNDGSSGAQDIHVDMGIRPAISLAQSVNAIFGTGTVNDPWVIEP